MNLELISDISTATQEEAASPTKPSDRKDAVNPAMPGKGGAPSKGQPQPQNNTKKSAKSVATAQVEDDDFDDDEMRKVREVKNIHKCWLELTPNKREFLNTVQTIFSEGLDCIQVIERWSKH